MKTIAATIGMALTAAALVLAAPAAAAGHNGAAHAGAAGHPAQIGMVMSTGSADGARLDAAGPSTCVTSSLIGHVSC